ncbi:uncharacterized protein LOC121738057 [Aricia agestis]|uniref:uncharacterized protein LOC121738057 n=1 Tax=Aricia agestis TaxID=91739 RepID=UPI001C20183C|nr:uncharacterized protein LOC121738057 [Aricia agestis]
MGLFGKQRKIDECTSNSSLYNLRYVAIEKPKWRNLFRKRSAVQIPTYHATNIQPMKGCPCGSDAPCKKKVTTPGGVTIHYPQKKKKLGKLSASKSQPQRPKGVVKLVPTKPKIQIVKARKLPAWLDKL